MAILPVSIRTFLVLSVFQLFSLSAFSQDSITTAQAKDNVGQTKTVTGTVMKVTTLAKTVVLEVDGLFPNAPFTAVIFNEKLPTFDKAALEAYKDKAVSITGKIALYKDKPQIILNEPSQITLAGAAPAAPTPSTPETKTEQPATPAPTAAATPTPQPTTATPAPTTSSAGNLLVNGGFNKGKKEWDIPAGAEVIADGDSQVLKIALKPGESVVVKQEIKKFPKDAKNLQANFQAKLTEGAKLTDNLKLHLGEDMKSGAHSSSALTPTTGSWQEVKWGAIQTPQSDSVIFFIEIPAGEGTLLLDNFHLSGN